MLTRGVLRIFRFHLTLCNLIGSISYEWDVPSNRLTTLKCPRKRLQFQLNILVGLIHNVFLICSFILQDIGAYGIAYQMLAIYFAGGYTLCNGLRVICWWKERDMAALINAQLSFEAALKEIRGTTCEEKSGGEGTEKILLTLGIMTGLSVPAFVFLILLAHPCLPPFIGSLLFTYKGNKCYKTSWWMYAGISLFDFWTHLDMVLPMVFSMFGLFFISIACLQDDIDVVERDLMRAKDGGGGGGLLGPLGMYRKLQVLEMQVNICFRRFYFPLFLSGMTALLVFCMHSCIKLPGKIPMPGFSYFPLVVVNGIVSLLVMNTKAANVAEHSMGLMGRLKAPLSSAGGTVLYRRKHWRIKMAESLKPLKVHFGMNFVDKVTPLLMINFSVNQVVSLLLIQSE